MICVYRKFLEQFTFVHRIPVSTIYGCDNNTMVVNKKIYIVWTCEILRIFVYFDT